MFVQELYGVFTAGVFTIQYVSTAGCDVEWFSVGRVQYCRAIYSCDVTAGDVCLVVGWLLLWLSRHLWSPSLSPRQILHRIVSHCIVSHSHVYCALIVSL